MPIVKLSKNEKRRISAFITCLSLALAAWIFSTLSTQYKFKIRAVINFINPPLRRSFRPLQPDTVDATMLGTGWNILFSRMNMDDKHITVDLHTLDNKNFVVLGTQIKTINDERHAAQPIASFYPDTLYFDFSARAVKKIPVRLQSNITFDKQYGISAPIIIKPAYVTVNGPAETVSKLTAWNTDSVVAKNVSDPLSTQIPLKQPWQANVVEYPKNVEVTIPVDEFTEKVLDVPIKLINNKNYYNVKVFPKSVKIIFMVSLNSYPLIDEHYFEAVADLSDWEKFGYQKLPVKLLRKPAFCKIVRIEPQDVDFIVRK